MPGHGDGIRDLFLLNKFSFSKNKLVFTHFSLWLVVGCRWRRWCGSLVSAGNSTSVYSVFIHLSIHAVTAIGNFYSAEIKKNKKKNKERERGRKREKMENPFASLLHKYNVSCVSMFNVVFLYSFSSHLILFIAWGCAGVVDSTISNHLLRAPAIHFLVSKIIKNAISQLRSWSCGFYCTFQLSSFVVPMSLLRSNGALRAQLHCHTPMTIEKKPTNEPSRNQSLA